MKKVIIIGAGVAGLAAGIYALKNGFAAEIYEQHSVAGGECTGWDRGAYHFDNCIQWLMGSKKGTVLNKIWRDVGALADSVPVIVHDYYCKYELDGRTLTLYNDVGKLERHLTELSPGDRPAIKSLCRAIRDLQTMQIPSKKPFDMLRPVDTARMIFKMLPYWRYMKYNNITISELAGQFKDPLVRMALERALLLPDISAMSLLNTLSCMCSGDGGVPEGGSRRFAGRMADEFKRLGGGLFLKSSVERILTSDHVAKGIVLAGGREVLGDTVISAADGYECLFRLLDGKYLSDLHRQMYSVHKDLTFSSINVFAGVAADLSEEPGCIDFALPEPVTLGGCTQERIVFKNYCYDQSFAPEHHSVLTAIFFVANYDWWNELYADRERYAQEKDLIARAVTGAIEERFPAARGRIEEVDVVTPMTYVRYCHAWRGSYMSWIPAPGLKTRFLPMKLDGLKNFIMAGQWIMPPGGLPPAVLTGRWAIQHLCADEKTPFAG